MVRDNRVRTLRTKNGWLAPIEVTGQAMRNELHEMNPLLEKLPIIGYLFHQVEEGNVEEETINDFFSGGGVLVEVAGRYFVRYGEQSYEIVTGAATILWRAATDFDHIGTHASQFACEYGNAAATGMVIGLPGIVDTLLIR